MDRKQISINDEETETILSQLEAQNYFKNVYGNFSAFVRYHIKKAHNNPDKARLEYKKEKKKKLEKEIDRIEDRINESTADNGKSQIDEKKDQIADEIIEIIDRKMSEENKEFYQVFNKYETGYLSRFNQKGINIDKKELNDLISDKAKEKGLID